MNHADQRLKTLTVVRQWRVLPPARGEPAQHHQLFGRIAGSAVRVKDDLQVLYSDQHGRQTIPAAPVTQSRRHTENMR